VQEALTQTQAMRQDQQRVLETVQRLIERD
jgi:hypothetical protein